MMTEVNFVISQSSLLLALSPIAYNTTLCCRNLATLRLVCETEIQLHRASAVFKVRRLPSRQKVMLPFSQPGELMPMARQIHFVVKRRIGTSTFMRRDLVYALMIEAIRVGHGL